MAALVSQRSLTSTADGMLKGRFALRSHQDSLTCCDRPGVALVTRCIAIRNRCIATTSNKKLLLLTKALLLIFQHALLEIPDFYRKHEQHEQYPKLIPSVSQKIIDRGAFDQSLQDSTCCEPWTPLCLNPGGDVEFASQCFAPSELEQPKTSCGKRLKML